MKNKALYNQDIIRTKGDTKGNAVSIRKYQILSYFVEYRKVGTREEISERTGIKESTVPSLLYHYGRQGLVKNYGLFWGIIVKGIEWHAYLRRRLYLERDLLKNEILGLEKEG